VQLRPFVERIGSYLAAALIPPLLTVALFDRWTWRRLLGQFIVSLIFTVCIAAPLEVCLRWLAARIHHRGLWITAPAYIGLMATLAVLGTLVGSCLICSLGLVPWEGFGRLYAGAVKVSLLLTFIFGAGGLATELLKRRLQEANLALKRKEEDARRARALATEARLASLESRVHPHFLFNAINSILSLIRDDPTRAEHLLERMAALLRFSLDQTHGGRVPLEKELRVVRDYLEIEQARFGQRLRFSVEVEPGLSAGVPPLSIQTLVENSVKYAVSPRREGGTIRVKAFTRGGQAHIEVWDDGPGFDAHVTRGTGLQLVEERLGALDFERNEQGMTVRARLPLGVPAPAVPA